jgi:hydroxymethylglutaryl-CoA synthase
MSVCRDDLSYNDFLTWRGLLHREPPRRPEPDRPAAPPSLRSTAWKYGLFGSRDEGGFVHLPPSRVSMEGGAIDRMEMVRMADVQATIATFTVDRLAFSLSPPVVAVVIDFDAPPGDGVAKNGGRFQCELTDADPAAVRIGDRVEMTFRRLYTTDGIHNYFWKARPVQGTQEGS